MITDKQVDAAFALLSKWMPLPNNDQGFDRERWDALQLIEAQFMRFRSILHFLYAGPSGPMPEGFVDDPRDCYEYAMAINPSMQDLPKEDPAWFEGWLIMIEVAMEREQHILPDLSENARESLMNLLRIKENTVENVVDKLAAELKEAMAKPQKAASK